MQQLEDFLARKKTELGVSLNPVQAQAVLQTEGPVLLLASPGSGKTTTLIMRIGFLIEEKAVDPTRIKAVTFSRASASDMKERFKRFFPYLQPVDFSTIHSLAFEVVRNHFYRTQTAYQLIEGDVEQKEQQESDLTGSLPLHKKIILRELFKSTVGENITEEQLEELTTYISYIKNKLIPEAQWPQVKVDVPEAERILRAYEAYKRTGHHKLLVDFDDMLTIANGVLEREPGLLRSYQRRYDYILTDESQDTSAVQHAIIEKLAAGHGNLCVVADDDQSIYSWRGAEPSYLLNFKQVYPQAVTLFMEQNYRSSKAIVHAANQFIKRNQNRYEKNMFTDNAAGDPIRIRNFASYPLQAKYLVQEIGKLEPEQLAEVAVLYRNNSSSLAIMNAFDRAGISFYMKDADNRFFSHWVVEDILNFMRMTFTDKRPDILEKIHLKFNGYISKLQMARLKEIDNQESVFDNLLQHVPLQDYQVKALQACKDTFQQMKGMPPLEAIRVIRERLGYVKALEKMCERLGFRKETLIGIVNTLEEIAVGLETMEDFANRLKHLEAVLKNAKSRKGQNAVTFSTFHSSKGLEFDQVYMIDLVEGVMPSSDDRDSTELLEESARLFYVGMTRARIQLELISYRERDGEKTAESPYVSAVRDIQLPPKQVEATPKKGVKGAATKRATPQTPIPYNPNAIRDQAELAVGASVKHRVFGTGSIVGVAGERIRIRFVTGEKALAIATCLEMGLLEAL